MEITHGMCHDCKRLTDTQRNDLVRQRRERNTEAMSEEDAANLAAQIHHEQSTRRPERTASQILTRKKRGSTRPAPIAISPNLTIDENQPKTHIPEKRSPETQNQQIKRGPTGGTKEANNPKSGDTGKGTA